MRDVRELLGQAERGEVRALAVALEKSDGTTDYWALGVSRRNLPKMIGEVECMKYALAKRAHE